MNGVVVWFTGRPSSGKSTLAEAVRARLDPRSTPSCVIDGDALRRALTPRPGYDPKSRDEFYATLANVAALLARQGLVVLVAATAHLRAFRERARKQAPAFIEVFVNATLEEVHSRDTRGLYAAVRQGRIGGVPGADLGYEAPEHADVVASGGRDEQAVAQVVSAISGAIAQQSAEP
jgi:adenylylsulfate kinase